MADFTASREWWSRLDQREVQSQIDGLVTVRGYKTTNRPPEEVVMMEKAREYGASAVFFEAARNGRPPVAQAFIYFANGPEEDREFATVHQKLWSWGGVPLVYRKLPGLVQLFRCAHGPDFVSKKSGEIICNPVRTLQLASSINSDPWWQFEQLRNGTLWDDPAACKALLSAQKAAHKALIDAVSLLSAELNNEGILPTPLRRKLLILSLLIAYLEQREVFKDNYLSRFLPGATKFFQVLADGPALVSLLDALEKRFNGNVFSLGDADKERLRNSQQLRRFSRLIEGREESGGQLTLWQLYSFKDLPVELISHIYQLFVTDKNTAVYTPPFLVRLMLEEVLSWKRLDRLKLKNEIVLDPSCGSGVFLVEAYKRLVLHWRSRNAWKKPDVQVLKGLLQKVHGVDLEEGAVELAAFSLCLALCDALEPEEIRSSIKLFPGLAGTTLHRSCFFEAKEKQLIKAQVGVVVGNPPFASKLNTAGAERSYKRYCKEHGSLPDRQVAYLFLHEGMEMVAEGGALCMLQQYNFIYNQQSLEFRRCFFGRWDVREILDFISVRGLFHKGKADTKIVVVVAEAAHPPKHRKILHATFRRSGRIDAEQGFDIDYYDLHWVPRHIVLEKDAIWRSNLLGGARVLTLIDRLKEYRALGQFAKDNGWDYGEGFIEAVPNKEPSATSGKNLTPAPHLTGKKLLPSNGITVTGIDWQSIDVVKTELFRSAYSERRFTAPMVLVHEQFDLNHDFVREGYLTYKNQIVGFCGLPSQQVAIREVANFLRDNKRPLQAFVAGTSVKLFTQHATTLSAADVVSLPFPESKSLEISENEKILVDDIVDYYRDLIRLGEDSAALKTPAVDNLSAFCEVFEQQINSIYRKNPVRALPLYMWPGVVCQPFVFGNDEVEWGGAEELKGRLEELLMEQRNASLNVTRICRMYDRNFIFLIKPDRLRYWMRSIALRDADETLVDLRAQGF
jgi:hypothetical protein